MTDPLGHTTNYTRDTQGNATSIADGLQHASTFTYGPDGQALTAADPLGHTTTYTYTGGDLTAVTDPLGRTTTTFLDAAGRGVARTDALGSVYRYQFDGESRILQTTDPLEGVTALAYDPNGNVTDVTDARLSLTHQTYTNRDQVDVRTDPLTRSESSVYDLIGNLVQFTDRKGQVSEFVYDRLNRRTFAGYGKSGTTYQSTIGYAHDAGNRLTEVVDSCTGSLVRTYDVHDRLLSETSAVGTITYTYDPDGRRASATVSGQVPVTYQYDTAERLTSITQGTSVVAFAYDDANRRTSLTYPNGVVGTYEYDGASQLTRIAYQAPGGFLGDITYTYDDRGNRTQIGGSWGRTALPPAVASAVHDAANQLTQWGGQTHTYDANGNLTADGTNVYAWNARNELSGITGGSTAAFTYDGVGRRRSKTVGGTSAAFLYDNANVVQELAGSTPTASLMNGLSVDQRFVRTDASGSEAYLTDALGSTVGLANSSAAANTQYTFEPFGAASSTGSTSTNTFQFTGREDDGTGLAHYRARYYDAEAGRFISEDPIRFAGGVNFFSYVLNDPLGFTDPFGLDIWVCYYPDAAQGNGHVGFGLPGESETSGFFPRDGGPYGPGRVGPDSYPRSACRAVPASQEQEDCMRRCRQSRASDPGQYNVFSRNCTAFVRDCLAECGVYGGPYSGPYPGELFRRLPGPVIRRPLPGLPRSPNQ